MKKLSLLLAFFIFSCQSLTGEDNFFQQTNVEENENPAEAPNPFLTHNQLESRDLITPVGREKKIKVALFVPLSGKHKELGWYLFNAATLSLFETDVNHNIELVLVDSTDDPKTAKESFQKIIDENIKLVIGPVFSSTIAEIEKDVRRNDIVAISLSNNRSLSNEVDDDGGVFIAGILPETQIDKIISYSMSRGKNNFAILAPNNQYGVTISNIAKKFVKDRDGNFLASEFYNSSGRGLDKAVLRAINSFSIPAELIGKRNMAKKDAVISEADRIYPDVILIPESGKILSRIVRSIKNQNIAERDYQIIGTSQWDNISTLNDINLVGAWFAAPESDKFHEFEKSYYQSYNRFPPRISSIVYDSVMAISQLINYKDGHIPTIEDFTSYSTNETNGFNGVDGLFRFLPNGLVQRNLAILEVGSGKFETIEKPNDKFLKY